MQVNCIWKSVCLCDHILHNDLSKALWKNFQCFKVSHWWLYSHVLIPVMLSIYLDRSIFLITFCRLNCPILADPYQVLWVSENLPRATQGVCLSMTRLKTLGPDIYSKETKRYICTVSRLYASDTMELKWFAEHRCAPTSRGCFWSTLIDWLIDWLTLCGDSKNRWDMFVPVVVVHQAGKYLFWSFLEMVVQ